jgi:hypothetical protein
MCCQCWFLSIIFCTSYMFRYLMFSNISACPLQNSIKSVSIMTSNNLKAKTKATPKVSGILNILQTISNGQCLTSRYNLSSTVTSFYRIITIYPVTDPQYNDNSYLISQILMAMKSENKWQSSTYILGSLWCITKDWMAKGNVEVFSCYRMSLKHSSVYTVFYFIYIRCT